MRGANPPFLPRLQARPLPSVTRGVPRHRRHESLFLGARYQPFPVPAWCDASPHFLSALGLLVPVVQNQLARVRNQPFPGRARLEPPSHFCSRGARGASTPLPAQADHPSAEHPRRQRPLPDCAARRESLLSGRVARAPLSCARGPPETAVLPRTRRVPPSRAVFPHPKKGVPTRGPRGLHWTWRGSPLRAVCFQTAHGVVPTRGQHAVNWARRGSDPAELYPEKD